MPAVDLHAHVLPGVDDGPATLDGTFALAEAAIASGTRRIVATPHINESRFIGPEAIGPAVEEVNRHLAQEGVALDVEAGAEIALPRLLDLTDADLRLLRLGTGPYLLLECPFAMVAGEFEPLIFEVQSRGHLVLLAHPERCPAFQRDPDRLARLVDRGALVQLTAGALRGAFGTRTRDFAHHLLREDLVHVLASDAHDAVRRPPGLGDALERAERAVPGILAREEWLTEEVPTAILAGDPLPFAPPLAAASRRSEAWAKRLMSLGRN